MLLLRALQRYDHQVLGNQCCFEHTSRLSEENRVISCNRADMDQRKFANSCGFCDSSGFSGG